MLFMTATSIGLMAGLTRNVVAIAATALLIFATFVSASIYSGGASYLNLLITILGFNFGLINLVVATAVLQGLRHA